MLIAVEAAQFLDGITIRLLRGLANEQRATGLIVLMVDSDQLSGDASGVPEETLGDWLSSEEREQRLTRIRLGRLPDQELTEIAIGELGAGLDPVMLARVVEYAGGVPGVLCELLDAPAVAGALRGGGEGPDDLAVIPRLDGVQAALRAATASTRRALAVASVHGMRTVREWLAGPSPTTGARAPAGDLRAMRGALDDAIGSGWLRQRPGTQIVEFASPQLLQVCRAEQVREDPAVIRAAREALLSAKVTAHADHSWDDLDWDVRESLLASVVGKDPDAPLMDAAHAELAAELFTLRRATGRDATTRELLAAITDRLAAQRAPAGVLIVATAEALFDAGLQDKAFQLLGDEFARLQGEFGDDDTQTLSALHNLAAAYGAAAAAAHGHPKAEPLYQTGLTLYNKLLDHRVTAYEKLLDRRVTALEAAAAGKLVIFYSGPIRRAAGRLLPLPGGHRAGPSPFGRAAFRSWLRRSRHPAHPSQPRLLARSGWGPGGGRWGGGGAARRPAARARARPPQHPEKPGQHRRLARSGGGSGGSSSRLRTASC